jgi:ABC-type multidrug transport system permease subunit
MAIGLPIAMPLVQGLLMGLMYQGIGNKAFSQQLPFVFMQLTNLCMTGMQLIPALIQERTYMKYDAMEKLYSEEAFLLAATLVDVPLCLTGALLNVIVMYTLSGMAWEYFATILGWAVLLFFVFDSLFGFITAFASDGRMAQVMSLPFNIIFMMFSGFMVTKAAAPSYLRWVFDISPNGYAMQAIVMRMAPDYGMEGEQVVKTFGFEGGQNTRGFFVMLALIAVFRLGQVLAMRYLNNVQK